MSVDLPVIGHVTQASADEPFLAFVLELRPDEDRRAAARDGAGGHRRPEAVDAMPAGIAVSNASPALLDAIARLLALLDAPEDAAALSPGLEREILWRLLTGPQGATVRQIGLGRQPARAPGPRDPLDPRPLRRDAARRGARGARRR